MYKLMRARRLAKFPAPKPNTTPVQMNGSRLSYLPALDGLRALAVLAVLAYHADLLWLPGGFLGVEIFFVVSGYLITSLLLAEYRADNRINLKNFWQRRARRLLPALFALLGVTLVYAVLFLPGEVASLREDVAAAFAYVTNWYLIFAQQSYFEQVGRPSLLRHLWSLAVEEQFYLIFPLLFAFVLTRLKTRGALLFLMLGATLSALWMGILFQPDTDPSRIYYGTDTRAAGLLIGAALAFAWTPRPDDQLKRGRRWALDALGLVGIAGLVAACLWLSEFDPFLYQGGFMLVAAATAFTIAAAVHPQSPILAPLLGIGVLRWIGLRSYSLYLWHWPVFMLTRPELDTTLTGVPLFALRFGLTFVLAELSFRIVETPLRRGALGRAWNNWKNAQGFRRWRLTGAWVTVLSSATVGAFLLGSAVLNAAPPEEPDLILLTPEEEAVSGGLNAALLDPNALEPDQVNVSSSIPVSLVIGVGSGEENPAPRSLGWGDDSWLRALAWQLPASLLGTVAPSAPSENSVKSSVQLAQCDVRCETRLENQSSSEASAYANEAGATPISANESAPETATNTPTYVFSTPATTSVEVLNAPTAYPTLTSPTLVAPGLVTIQQLASAIFRPAPTAAPAPVITTQDALNSTNVTVELEVAQNTAATTALGTEQTTNSSATVLSGAAALGASSLSSEPDPTVAASTQTSQQRTTKSANQSLLESSALNPMRSELAANGSVKPNATRPAPNSSPNSAATHPELQPVSTGSPVLAIGDSVMLGASHYLQKAIADVYVDAKVGRQVSAALQILRARKDANQLTPLVIVHLGNNGTFSAKQLDEMMAVLSEVERVVFLTDKVPRKWQEPNNNALIEGVKRYPNAVLIDWNAFSAAHPEWFWSDGIHLRPEGAEVYASLIANALTQGQP